MQSRYSGGLTDDNGHRTCVVRICNGFSYTAEGSSVLKVLCSSKVFARMKSRWADARWIDRMKRVCSKYTRMHNVFKRMARIFYVLHPLCIRNCSGTGPLRV